MGTTAPTDPPDNELIRSVLEVGEIQDVAEELLELGLDEILENELVSAIPVVKLIVGLERGLAGFRERRFARKLIAMLYGLGQPSAKDLTRWRERLESEPELREMGERLLAIVDRVTSITKAKLVGRAWKLWLDGKCDRSTFLRCCEMIDAALTEDLTELAKGDDFLASEEGRDVSARLISVGLVQDRSDPIAWTSSQPPTASREGALLRDAMG